MPVRPGKRSLHRWIAIAYIHSYTADINHRQRSGAALFSWQRAARREYRGWHKVDEAREENIEMKWKFISERLKGGARRATPEILMRSTALLQPVWDSRGSLKWHWRVPSANLPVDPRKSCTCSRLYLGVPLLYKHITCSSAHADYMHHYRP